MASETRLATSRPRTEASERLSRLATCCCHLEQLGMQKALAPSDPAASVEYDAIISVPNSPIAQTNVVGLRNP